jgi:hypothetical protein
VCSANEAKKNAASKHGVRFAEKRSALKGHGFIRARRGAEKEGKAGE